MFDIRSYIISLIAVFLALGIGILMGTVVVDKGVLVEQQKALIERIQNQINETRETNKVLTEDLRISEDFAKQTTPLLIANRLSQTRVVLISTPSASEEFLKEILSLLGIAGAETFRVNIISPSFELKDKNIRSQTSSYFGEDNLPSADLKTRIVQEIGLDLAQGRDLPFIKFLTGLNLIRTGENIDQFRFPPDAVILVGEKDKLGEPVVNDLFVPLIGKFKEMGLRTVAVELSQSENSYTSEYQRAGVNATVDNIEKISGKVALIYALAGKDGNFGTKPPAQSLLPPLE